MPPPVAEQLSRTIESLYRSESGRVQATLVRLLGDMDLAEEAMHEAFTAAPESWPQNGIPDKPHPWLIATARFEAIHGLLAREHLSHYHPAHSARADLCRRLGRIPEARASYEKAIAWARKGAISCDVAGEVRELLFFPAPEQGPGGSK